MRINVVREGRDHNNEFSAGTMVRITCAKEYKINFKNANSTAKCVRGRWKPVKPECTLSISFHILPHILLDYDI